MYIFSDPKPYKFSLLPKWCCFKESLIHTYDNPYVVFISHKGRLISYYMYEYWGDKILLHLFQIIPNLQNKGHGSRIISIICSRHSNIKLECDSECIDFYLKNGFSIAKMFIYSCKMIYNKK